MSSSSRFVLGAVGTVTAIFFVIRIGVALLAREAGPPPSPAVVSRSPSSPALRPATRAEAKRDAHARLLSFASEANASHHPKAATAAYDAERALMKEDCPATQTALARARDSIPTDDATRGALESATRAVDAFCLHGTQL